MNVLARFDLVAHDQQGLASARQLATEGVGSWTLTRAVRAHDLCRVAPATYSRRPLPPPPQHLVTHVGPDPDFVVRARAALLARPGSAAHGTTAACLYGWGLLVEPRGAPGLLVPHGCSGRLAGVSRPGAGAVHRARQAGVLPVRVLPGTRPVLVTTPTTTALACARSLPFREAVVVVDSALRSGLVDLEGLRAGQLRRGLVGARSVADVLAAVDPWAGSVLESVARMDLRAAGLGGFHSQNLVAGLRVDFAWPSARLVLEVDGQRWHPDPAHDRARDNRLVTHGWRPLRLTWRQVLDDPDWTGMIADALRRSPGEVLLTAPTGA